MSTSMIIVGVVAGAVVGAVVAYFGARSRAKAIVAKAEADGEMCNKTFCEIWKSPFCALYKWN